MRPLLSALALICVLSACAPTDPQTAARFYAAQVTAIQDGQNALATAAPVTQSYLEAEYAKSLTATALPPQQTATQQALQLADIAITQAWDNRTATAVAQTVAYSQTAVVLTVKASEAQVEIAENNAAIANHTTGVNAIQALCFGGVGLALIALACILFFLVYRGGMFLGAWFAIAEINAKWDAVFDREDKARKFRLEAPAVSAVTLAERHVARYGLYDALGRWRALALAYAESAQHVNREHGDYAFSEPTALKYALILYPDKDAVWREGHRRLMGWLVECKVMSKTGGGKTDWAKGWTYERFAREFSRIPLPPPPEGPIPRAKLLGRGWEDGEVREVVRLENA